MVPLAVSDPFPRANETEADLWGEMDFSMSTPDSIVKGLGDFGTVEG